jgi:hypothetical protein
MNLTTQAMFAVKNINALTSVEEMELRYLNELDDTITWYSPKVVWFERAARPERIETKYYKCKDDYVTNFDKVVLEWDTIKAPKDWESCNG